MPASDKKSHALANALISDLRQVLLGLHRDPYPSIPNPPNCKRRAAVACVIRVRPTYPDIHSKLGVAKDASLDEILPAFFDQKWVKRGEPEILFIKRAARKGDRFTSHVAFPGGKREPGDATDQATAARETVEEVGLDLDGPGMVTVGPLPERVVTTE